jgi:hypothetical protein
MKRNFILLLIFSVIILSACKKEDVQQLRLPSTYNFENVDISAQTHRINMLYAMLDEMKKGTSQPLSNGVLRNMYANSGSPYLNSILNNSGVQLRDQTYMNDIPLFESYLDKIADVSISHANPVTGPGQAGTVVSIINHSVKYLVDENGVQYDQVIKNRLMGASYYYRVMDVLTTKSELDDSDNNTVIPGQGTEMQHKWDEAFGYWGATPEMSTGNFDSLDRAAKVYFWAHYTGKGKDIKLVEKLLNAYIAGRDAINRKDYQARDAAAANVRKYFELAVACTYISYLNQGIAFHGDYATRCHTLSESIGWLYSLNYYSGKKISQTDFDEIANKYYVNGELSISHFTVGDLAEIRDQVSSIYDLDAIKANL